MQQPKFQAKSQLRHEEESCDMRTADHHHVQRDKMGCFQKKMKVEANVTTQPDKWTETLKPSVFNCSISEFTQMALIRLKRLWVRIPWGSAPALPTNLLRGEAVKDG